MNSLLTYLPENVFDNRSCAKRRQGEASIGQEVEGGSILF